MAFTLADLRNGKKKEDKSQGVSLHDVRTQNRKDYTSKIDTTDLSMKAPTVTRRPSVSPKPASKFTHTADLDAPVSTAKTSLPDHKNNPFANKPVDSRLLPSNVNVRATTAPKKKNPIVAGYDQLIHGAQTAVLFQQQPTNEVPSTGSEGLDKFLRVTGGFLPGLMSGAPMAGNIATDTSSIVQHAGNKLAPKLVSKVFQASPQAAYAIQKAAPVVSKVAGHAVGAGVENAAVGAAAGQTDAKQVGENLTAGAALGGAGSVVTHGVGAAFKKLFQRSGMPEEVATQEVDKILSLPMGRVDAARLRRAPKGGVNDTIADPYTFGLPSPKTAEPVATSARVGQRANPWRDKYNELIGLAHNTKFTPGRELEELDQLWASIASKEDPGLDELIKLAHPTYTNKLEPGLAGKARNYQSARDAAGAPLPIKRTEQIPQGAIAEAAPIAQKVGRATREQAADLPKQAPKAKKAPGEAAPLPKAEPKKAAPPPKTEPTRSNYETMQSAEGLSPELKKEIAGNDQRYEPITNKETVKEADTEISKQGVDKSVSDFLTDDRTDAKSIAKGYRLMQILDARGEHKAAAGVAAKVAENLTKAGQQAQAGRIIKKLSPEGQSLALARVAEENGKTVTAVDQKNFSAKAKVRAETMGAELRTNAVHDTVDNVKAGKKASSGDVEALKNTIERAKKQLPAEKAKPKPKTEAQAKKSKVLDALQKAEDEAWKRIRARRNIGFTPGKGNELVDYSIILANRVARGTVKASNHVEQVVKMFGEKYRPQATKIYNMSLKHVARHPELKVIKKNISTAEEVVAKWEKMTATSGKDLEKVRELAEAVGKLEGKQGKAADVAMQQIMNKYEKSDIFDKVQALRFMDMLGNTHTQGLNFSSNVSMAAFNNTLDIFGHMVDVVVSKAMKRERSTTVFGMNPVRWSWRILKYLREGAHANWKGVNPGGLHSIDEIHGLAFKSKWWNLAGLNWGERGLKAVAGGSDYAVYRTQFENELVKQAKLAASKEKISGKAERERFQRDFLANPPSEALEIADTVGKEATFQQKNSLGNVAANLVSSAGHMKGGAKWPGKIIEQGARSVVPFIRTPLNILETGVSLTPGGAIRGIAQLIVAKTPAAQRAAIRHIGLSVAGTAILSPAGFYLHKIGVITDANDSGNKNLDSVREQSGHGAYRFNQSGMWRYLKVVMGGGSLQDAEKVAGYQEGDRTFNYNKLQPIAFPVALGAGIQEGGVKGGLTQAAGSLLSMSMLKSVQDVISTGYSGSEGEKQIGAVNRWVESYLKSFSPGLLAQEARREDTTQRQTSFNEGYKKDLGDYYKSRIPGLSKSLPAKVTALGQTKQGTHNNVAGNYLNPIQSDVQQYSRAAAIIAVLIDKTGNDSIAPSAPPKKIDGVAIPPKRYEQYQRELGTEITEKVLRVGDRNISDDRKLKQIAQIMLDTKAKYRDKLKKELGIKDKLK